MNKMGLGLYNAQDPIARAGMVSILLCDGKRGVNERTWITELFGCLFAPVSHQHCYTRNGEPTQSEKLRRREPFTARKTLVECTQVKDRGIVVDLMVINVTN